MNRNAHPSAELIEAVVFGWVDRDQAAAIQAHVEICPRCDVLFRQNVQVHDLLRVDPPQGRHQNTDIVGTVLSRVDAPSHRWSVRVSHMLRLSLVMALVLVLLTGVVTRPAGQLQASVHWIQSLAVREIPAAGEDTPPAQLGSSSGSSPVHVVSLDEARQLANFPVATPQFVPDGFTLQSVSVLQPVPSGPVTQVFVLYERTNAHQPLSIAYLAPTAQGEREIAAPPGTVVELTLNGYHATYIDASGEGLRAMDNDDVLQPARLIMQRPDVIVSASGDRRDGFDIGTLSSVLLAIP